MTVSPHRTANSAGRVAIRSLRNFLAKETARWHSARRRGPHQRNDRRTRLWKSSYETLCTATIGGQIAGHELTLDLHHWVNEDRMRLWWKFRQANIYWAGFGRNESDIVYMREH